MKTLISVLLILWASNAYSTTINGVASVIDGDTIEIHGQRIRFHGIDAPESRQLCRNLSDGKEWRCGQAAALALSDLIGRKTVSCTKKTKDRYGRIVAVCSLQSININNWLVENGWALDWPHYSKGSYNIPKKPPKPMEVVSGLPSLICPGNGVRENIEGILDRIQIARRLRSRIKD